MMPIGVSRGTPATYQYDGGPRNLVPTPSPAPMTNPAQPTAPADGRFVSNTAGPRYLAYGETEQTPARATRIAAQPTESSDDFVQIVYRPSSSPSFDGGTMIYTQTGTH